MTRESRGDMKTSSSESIKVGKTISARTASPTLRRIKLIKTLAKLVCQETRKKNLWTIACTTIKAGTCHGKRKVRKK